MSRKVYLDNSATTAADDEVVKAVTSMLTENYGNPSSAHRLGLKAEKIVEKARKELADYLQVNKKEIIFTSGGTESNNLAVQGITKSYHSRGSKIITTEIEHPSVRNIFLALEKEGWDVIWLKSDQKGYIDIEQLKNSLDKKTVLVSIMQVNNELGSVQNIEEIGKIIKKINPLCFFHVDGIQGFGKVFTDLKKSSVDLYSISGHKFHAPKGIGALYIRENIELQPLFFGGGQENDIRPGTENTPGIAGLIPAVKKLPILNRNINTDPELNRKRNYLYKSLSKMEDVAINSPKQGAPHILNFSVPGIKGETLLHALEAEGVFLSTGSACSSKSKENKVLKAVGLSSEKRDSALRISLNKNISRDDLDYTLEVLKSQIDFLKIF
ncbi:cysteine desulfurase [Halanaerobium sp. DL-01]|uniref:cysteine desulfurase family protein n=1 Tax=Halanaerobium sp. DL-01 TaxID=1653064 RepID=UPI000DF45ACA|nr:cysteine desulfurase family protein [Halanaerobium sp. DL-01]RCW81081.1 cysteine desulfurase [Halanaerobium sp. DL-01]